MTIEETLEELKYLTIKKDHISIKKLLEQPRGTAKEKGDLLEFYMKELYEGNGWICQHIGGKDDKGADLLLSHPKTPSKIEHIVQTKNYNKPLGFKETRSELIQFEEIGAEEYNCYDYKLISINGYSGTVSEINMLKKLQLFNISLLDFSYIRQLIDTYNPCKANLQPTMVLYAHNELSYTSILNTWESSNKAAIIMATGTGKSKVAIKLFKENFNEKPKLLLAPTRYILNQFKNDTDALGLKNIIYLTYSKLHRLKPDELEKLKPSVIVFDEFHRCGSKKWLKTVQNLMDKNKDCKTLGLSATPIRTDRKDMSAILFDNNIANILTVQEAIVTGKLPMPTYVSGIYDLEDEKNRLKECVLNSIHSESEKKSIINKIDKASIDWENSFGAPEILRKYLQKNSGKGIVFCENADHLHKMEEVVRKWFKKAGFMIKTNTVISKDPEHNIEFEEFKNSKPKNKIHILFCINKISEGVHLHLDFALFLRKTSSEIIYMQQMGRVLQAGRNDNPIIFDFVCNFMNVKNNNFLNDLISTSQKTNSLRNELGLSKNICSDDFIKGHIHDETQDIQKIFSNIRNNLITTWDLQFEKAKAFFNANGHCNIPYGYNDDKSLSFWVANQRTQHRLNILSPKRIQLLESIDFIWSVIDESWMDKYEELKEFYKINNHTTVKKNKKVNTSLENWVAYQRSLYRKNKLSIEKINLLNQINFIWDVKDAEWLKNFNLLKGFIESEPRPNKLEYKVIISWSTRQRRLYKEGKLSDDKVSMLNSIGFLWDPLEDEWTLKYDKLKEFTMKYGHSNVPSTYPDKTLAQWVADNRKMKKNNKLSKKRIDLLNELDFEWDLKNTLWIQNFNKLKAYSEKYNNTNVSRRYKDDPSLGQWVNEQRKAYRSKKLHNDRIKMLNELGFSWDPKAEEWDKRFNQVKEFFEIHNHSNIPSKYPTEPSLPLWLKNQRISYKNQKLDPYKVEKLNTLKIDWNFNL